MYTGQLLGFEEGIQEQKARQDSLDRYDETKKLKEEIE